YTSVSCFFSKSLFSSHDDHSSRFNVFCRVRSGDHQFDSWLEVVRIGNCISVDYTGHRRIGHHELTRLGTTLEWIAKAEPSYGARNCADGDRCLFMRSKLRARGCSVQLFNVYGAL